MTQNRLRNLDMGTLRSFVTIADAGSMTQAASRLFMTQSAISMQIKRLESALGLNVFERSAQGMKTTSEGEQLLQFANQMLALNDEAMGRLTSPDYEGVIRFGSPCDVIYPHIPRVLKEFSRDFPPGSAQVFLGSDFRAQGPVRAWPAGRHLNHGKGAGSGWNDSHLPTPGMDGCCRRQCLEKATAAPGHIKNLCLSLQCAECSGQG